MIILYGVVFLGSILFISLFVMLIGLPVYADETKPDIPQTKTVQYIIDHLDFHTFPSSLQPMRDFETKVTFLDFGYFPTKTTQSSVDLESSDKSWILRVQALRRTKSRLLICFGDFANNGGSYAAQHVLSLRVSSQDNKLKADKTALQWQDYPTYAQ